MSVEVNMENVKSEDNTTSFSGSTIYGNKLKKKTNKYKSRCLAIGLRIAIITSLLSLIGIATTLALQYNKCKSVIEHNEQSYNNQDNITPDANYNIVKLYKGCQGIVYEYYCLRLVYEPLSFDDAVKSCMKNKGNLPSSDLMKTWLSDYLDGTWGEEGRGLSKEKTILEVDISTELRSHFCLESFY